MPLPINGKFSNVSVSQRAISFLISDANLRWISARSNYFHVFRSSLLRHRARIVTTCRTLATDVAFRGKKTEKKAWIDSSLRIISR